MAWIASRSATAALMAATAWSLVITGTVIAYSASRRDKPQAEPVAMIRASTTMPASRPVNASDPAAALPAKVARPAWIAASRSASRQPK